MDEEQLLQWAIKYNIEEKTDIYFREYIKLCQSEGEDKFSEIFRLINYEHFTIENWRISYSIIYINDKNNLRHNISYTINMLYCKKIIGTFTTYFDDEGNVFDDDIDIDIERVPWVKRFCIKMEKNNYKNE